MLPVFETQDYSFYNPLECHFFSYWTAFKLHFKKVVSFRLGKKACYKMPMSNIQVRLYPNFDVNILKHAFSNRWIITFMKCTPDHSIMHTEYVCSSFIIITVTNWIILFKIQWFSLLQLLECI